MKRLTWIFLLFLPAIQAYCQPNNRIDALLKSYYPNNAPGAAVCISRHDTIVFKQEYGLANTATGQKIQGNTNFNIGSLTKQFTAFCIVQLAQQKKLSLTDKLIQYFPGFNARVGNGITLQQLLTHSSGIVDHYAFVDTILVKHATDKDVLEAVRNIDSTYFTPGTQYRYSNTAYCLLALVIEKISGMSYRDYIRKNIFAPLNMQHSTVLQIGTPVYAAAYGYNYDSSTHAFSKLGADEAIFFSTEGDGGVYTSTADYLRWFQWLQHPPPAVKAVVDKIRSPQFAIDAVNKLSYGYGWFISEKGTDKAVYHTGSNGGFRAMVFSIPASGYLVTVFSNRTGIDLEGLVQQINSLLQVTNNSFTKTEALVSFIDTSPIFAPCKEIR